MGDAALLEAGIRAYLDGNYERPIGKRYRDDGEPSKHDQCVHRRYMWEDCEPCIDGHFEGVLARAGTPKQKEASKDA